MKSLKAIGISVLVLGAYAGGEFVEKQKSQRDLKSARWTTALMVGQRYDTCINHLLDEVDEKNRLLGLEGIPQPTLVGSHFDGTFTAEELYQLGVLTTETDRCIIDTAVFRDQKVKDNTVSSNVDGSAEQIAKETLKYYGRGFEK